MLPLWFAMELLGVCYGSATVMLRYWDSIGMVLLWFCHGWRWSCYSFTVPWCCYGSLTVWRFFAMVLLKRLLDAGADAKIWPSQYGFRKRRGTEDALHCVRRAIELAWSRKGGAICLLALDWAKAFDLKLNRLAYLLNLSFASLF